MDSFCPAHSSILNHLWGWIRWAFTGFNKDYNPDNANAPFNKKAAEDLEKERPYVEAQRKIMEGNRDRNREQKLEEQRREEELKKVNEEKLKKGPSQAGVPYILPDGRIVPPMP